MITRKRVLYASVLLIIALMIGKHFHSSTAPAMPSVVVKTAAVKTIQSNEMIRAIGTVNASSVEITPETAGHVASIAFTDGASVKKGETLIQLDDSILKAKLQSMAAQYQFSSESYARLKKLAASGVVSRQALDQALADMKEKKAAFDEASVTDEKMKLVAPFDGTVGQRKVNVGDFVNPGQGVVTLTDTVNLRIEYNVPEQYLSALSIGQSVQITTSAYPNQIFKGNIAYISPTVNPENRTLAVYATLNPETIRLASGLFVDVQQIINQSKSIFVVPARSLVPVLEGNQVYKIVDGKAVSVDVQIGRRYQDMVEITKGLTAQDIIITDGQVKLTRGQSVVVHAG